MENASKITLGTVQLGMEYGISNKDGKPNPAKAYKILDSAIKGGITSFDTAAAYGDSETVLGNYFSTHKSDIPDPEIITKIAIPEDDEISNPKVLTEKVINLIRESLIRLKKESVHGVMLHNAENLYNYKGDIVDALSVAKAQGLAKNIGVSVYLLKDIEEFLKYDLMDCIQLPINVMDMRLINSGILNKLKKQSTAIYARSIFLQGLFFMDADNLPPKLMEAKPYLEKLREISNESGLTIAEIAFGYIRDLECIDNLVIGADNAKQVRENLKFFKSPKLGHEHINEIQNYFNSVPEIILNPGKWR